LDFATKKSRKRWIADKLGRLAWRKKFGQK
jgi:hypothetical protein